MSAPKNPNKYKLWKERLSKSHKGQTSWNKGKKGVMPEPWNKGKTKEEYPQLSNSGTNKGQIPWIKGKHHTQKSKNKMSEAHLELIPWMKGKHHTKEANEKNRIAHLGKRNSPTTEFKKGMIPWHKGRKGVYSEQVLEAMSNTCKERFKDKRNHPSWKGGITPLAKRIRNSLKYRQWRSDIFTRDDFTCQECNRRGIYLHAHHIESFAFILEINDIKTYEQAMACEELWNINNGITLCKDCHDLTKKGKNIFKEMI